MSKLKAMMRRRTIAFRQETTVVEPEEEQVPIGRTKAATLERSLNGAGNTEKVEGEEVVMRQKGGRRRHKTSLGILEDLIMCPICKQKLQSPRMLICQHTFCKKCLEVKLDESSQNGEDSAIKCPVCKTVTKDAQPAPNRSIESVLRAMDNSFVERSEKSKSLVVNFASMMTGHRNRTDINQLDMSRCFKCETTTCDGSDICQHCKKVFCKVCRTVHIGQLKDQLQVMFDQLQSVMKKMDQRVGDFQEKTENMKETVTKEFHARVAAMEEEKNKKLAQIEEYRTREENSAEDIKQRILESQNELLEQKDNGFDGIVDDNEKIKTFLELHRKSTAMISSALSWQTKVSDMPEIKIRDKEKDKVPSRPRVISDRKDIQRPSGLAVDAARGEVYVACPGNAQLIVLDKHFRVVRRIHNQPDMLAPQGVAYISSRQEVFVTDKWKHTIFVYDRAGHFLRRICWKGQGEGQLRCPEGLDVRQSLGWLYVADTGNDRVQILGWDGSYKGGIGPKENLRNSRDGSVVGVHSFNAPTDVAVSNNAIVVADSGNHKIKVFNHTAQLVFTIGGSGTYKGYFKSPEVVKFDEHGNIVVGDSDNCRIQIFSAKGSFLRTFGIRGSAKIGQFGYVSGVLCLPNNEILVADNKNNTLQLF